MQFVPGVMQDMHVNHLCSLTCIEHLLDGDSHVTSEHGVQQLDNENEARAEHQ